jgi:hypothetical protein
MTLADCDTLAKGLFAAGKLREMKHLAKVLGQMVAMAEKAISTKPQLETAKAAA